MKRSFHYILFAITVALSIVCGVMMFHTNVNADMTKYLPDDSQMKAGLEIMNSEFGSLAQMSGADVHVMFEGVRPKEIPGIRTLLEAYPDVNGVAYRVSTDSTHTVFDLDVPKSVDQKALGKQISTRFGGNCVVETSQDGATPPISVVIFAAVLIMVVLFLMAQSWFEPVIILITAGLAILLNMGTNALLPSVSITTNFIGSILQAVLSLDYCIVLLNRYRQEQDEHTDRRTAFIAANRAIRKAAPSILSSALTTVVGLLMLCFMRLKIGTDMGVVLAKGVICSLICTFTAMPSLMMLFRRVINHTAKKAYVPPTDKLARFVAAHKLPMAVVAVILFFGSWYFSRQTTIFFSAEAESKIEEVFPSLNSFVLVYDTQDEDSVIGLVDNLLAQPGIQSVISYPTLMSRPLTPAQMANHVRSLLTDFKDFMPEGATVPPEALNAITPEMMQLLYFMRSRGDEEPRLAFPDIARFLHTHVASNPLFAAYLDDEMKQQIEVLQSMLDVTPVVQEEPKKPVAPVAPVAQAEPVLPDTPVVVEEEPVVMPYETIAPIHTDVVALETEEDTVAAPQIEENRIALVPFIERLNSKQTSAVTVEMRKLTDTAAIRLPMSVNEMSVFIGSTPIQTRLVYGYAPGVKKMSPLQYVHLLVDDLFKRAGLAGMISEEQRTQLTQRAYLMDLADHNASLTPAQLNVLLQAFGVEDMTEDELVLIANPPKQEKIEPLIAKQPSELNAEAIVNSIADMQRSLHSTDTMRAVIAVQEKKQPVVVPVKKGPSREDLQAELFTELVFGEKTYTPEQMASKLARLMKLSNVKSEPVTPAQMSLLYDYYGSVHSNCDTLRLGFEPLVVYLCDTLVYDERLADILPDTIHNEATNIRSQLESGLGQLRREQHSLLVALSSLPKESQATYDFVDTLTAVADAKLVNDHYYVGESVMYAEMRGGFDHEMGVVTLLTILAIFLIVAITFRSVIVPTILVVTVMTAVYVNVVVAGLVTGQMLYLAYLIVQAILMGATIDYGILFANYYRENRKTMLPVDAICAAYKGSIRTILTSGLIMVVGPGAMALFIDDLMISNIVGCLAVGAFVAILLTLTVLPAVLVALDRLVVYGKKNRFTGKQTTND
ncbi:MAG: MMPL family transporter [Paludibacteraceae bacterium]|nr:MMPL family transporter [Paludibacteraceae bacterium]